MSTPGQVEIDGLRIGFERKGTGPPVLLLHGGLSDRREWTPQLELADEATLVMWDAPGCGASTDPPASFRMADYAAVLARFVDTLGLARPHVVGISFGATLALALYRRAPSLPRSLVLASPYAGWAGSLPPDVVAARLNSGLESIQGGAKALAEEMLPTLFSERAPREAVEQITAMSAEVRTAGARPMLHAMAESDLRDVLGTIAVPTLVIHGELDVRAPAAIVRALAYAIPGSILATLPGAGHQCNVESPHAFNAALRSFLHGTDGRS